MSKKVWGYNPRAARKLIKISSLEKSEIMGKCERFIECELKPAFIKPFDKRNKFNQLSDIYCRWRNNSVLFMAAYKNLSDSARDFEDKFARIKVMDKGCFSIDYMRHTGQWIDITYMAGKSLNECLKSIKELPHFLA
ncbi:MAG: hypothetical protein V1860_03770 [bacterium]